MKKSLLIIFIMLPFFFSNCSDNEEPQTTILETQFDQLIREYNINKNGLVVESVVSGIDTTQLVFSGRIGGKLWIGCYKKEDKRQILDWTEATKLDTVINFHKGYDEYEKFDVGEFRIAYPYKKNDHYSFILIGRNGDVGKAFSDLYFIDSNSLVKKSRTINTQQYYYQQILPWHDGIIAKLGSENFACYTMSGDSLFTLKNGALGVKDTYTAINYEECIDFALDYFSSDFYKYFFRRINLKTNETIWKNDNPPLKDLPSNVRLDKINIQKNVNIWVYEVNYTQFDGTKQVVKISLNIDNGDFEIL